MGGGMSSSGLGLPAVFVDRAADDDLEVAEHHRQGVTTVGGDAVDGVVGARVMEDEVQPSLEMLPRLSRQLVDLVRGGRSAVGVVRDVDGVGPADRRFDLQVLELSDDQVPDVRVDALDGGGHVNSFVRG